MSVSQSLSLQQSRRTGLWAAVRRLGNVCKLRIGATIAFTALAGVAITPGALQGWRVAVLGLAVLVASACAGGINQYVEVDLDRRMGRTRRRPFVTGELQRRPLWLLGFYAALGAAVLAAALATNWLAALFVFLGAFFYAVVYTVWLKRRTWLNIVIGGLAGSFAVLAGAAAVTPQLGALPWVFAAVLFLWTPSHFWSLAIAMHRDYVAARVPMLPVLIGDRAAARVILGNSVLLVAMSLVPVSLGLGPLYLFGALGGGLYLLHTNLRLVRTPSRAAAMGAFHASLVQLTLVLSAAMLDAQLLGGG